jgi:hypothetical protein
MVTVAAGLIVLAELVVPVLTAATASALSCSGTLTVRANGNAVGAEATAGTRVRVSVLTANLSPECLAWQSYGDWLWLELYDQTTGQRLLFLYAGCRCTVSALVTSQSTTTHTYVAYIAGDSATNPPPHIAITSNTAAVTWVAPPPVQQVQLLGNPSLLCLHNGDQRVADNTVEGVRTFVYTSQPSVQETDVCFRAATASQGFGGLVKIAPAAPSVTGVQVPSPGLSSLGTPSSDTNSLACTTTTSPANQVPGLHPMAHGGIATVSYLFDTYLNGSAAWACIQVGSTNVRVVVPIGAPSQPTVAGLGTPLVVSAYVVTFYPDPGTP